MIIQYIRDKNHNPVGCLIGEVYLGVCFIGYSFFNVKKETRVFKKINAFEIAFERMRKTEKRNLHESLRPFTKLVATDAIPEHAIDQYIGFVRRCQNYFQTKEIRVY